MQPNRLVQPEWLDELPASDRGAIRSRQDLRRLNFLMGHVGFIARLLRDNGAVGGMRSLIELGAGDGTFLLRLARRLAPQCSRVKAVLVDRQAQVSPKTRDELEKLGWKVEVATADLFQWLDLRGPEEGTTMIANLFLHHFQKEDLRSLLGQAALHSDLFAACEPRRSGLALSASRLLGLIGCNSVTRHDAVASVRAGFTGRELSELWPANSRWNLKEGNAGLFSHVFVARRKGLGALASANPG